MFTGITEATARVLEKSLSRLTLARPKEFTDIRRGSSVAVAGVCLTVVRLEGRKGREGRNGRKDVMVFDVVPETLKRTTLRSLKVGDRVNLERALSISRVIPSSTSPQGEVRIEGRFEGHMVLGHVDGIGRVEKAGGHVLTISYPKALRGLIVEKGSIAVDGVSLTLTKVTPDEFSVALIPHTLKETTLGELGERDKVNLEGDVIGKYVMRNRD